MNDKTLRKALATIGRKGGNNRAARLSPERRAEIARIAGSSPKKKRGTKGAGK